MKNEIKEILDKLKDCVNNPIDIEVDQFTQEAYHIPNYFCLDATTNDCKIFLDYITNLQTIEREYSAILSENAELEAELKEANDSITWWTNRFKAVEKDNKKLKEKINQYENPDDMTLFYMWLDEKAKDKMKQLQEENERLKSELNGIYFSSMLEDNKKTISSTLKGESNE